MKANKYSPIFSILIFALALSCGVSESSTLSDAPLALDDLSRHPDISILEKDGTTLYVVGETHPKGGGETILTDRIQAYVAAHPDSAIGMEGYSSGGALEGLEQKSSNLNHQIFGIEDIKIRMLIDVVVAIQWSRRVDELAVYKKLLVKSEKGWGESMEKTLQLSASIWSSTHRELMLRVWQQDQIKKPIHNWILQNQANPAAKVHKDYLLHNSFLSTLLDSSISFDSARNPRINEDTYRSGIQEFYDAFIKILLENGEIPNEYLKFFEQFAAYPMIDDGALTVTARNRAFTTAVEAYIAQRKPRVVFIIIGKSHQIGVLHDLIVQRSWKHVRSDLSPRYKSLLAEIAKNEKSELEAPADSDEIEKFDSVLKFARMQIQLFHELSDQPNFKFQ